MAHPFDAWLHSNEDPVNGYPRRVASPESFVDSATPAGKPSENTSFSSSGGSSYGSATDSSSRTSSTSTTPSTAPSLHLPGHNAPVASPPPLAATANVADHYLPCEFAYAGCGVFYNLDDFDSWLSHSLTHFERAGPPPKAICTICDCRNATFEASGDRVSNWSARMRHMANHFENGKTAEDTRPDFSTIKYLRSLALLSEEDYKSAMSYSERPIITNLVPHNYKTAEMLARERKLNAIVSDPGDEDRKRRRERRS